MASYSYTPSNVCAKRITFDMQDGKLHNIEFTGGCPGNLMAIGKLLEGADAKEVIGKLKGNICGNKPTSCADQLAIAVEEAIQKGA